MSSVLLRHRRTYNCEAVGSTIVPMSSNTDGAYRSVCLARPTESDTEAAVSENVNPEPSTLELDVMVVHRAACIPPAVSHDTVSLKRVARVRLWHRTSQFGLFSVMPACHPPAARCSRLASSPDIKLTPALPLTDSHSNSPYDTLSPTNFCKPPSRNDPPRPPPLRHRRPPRRMSSLAEE